MIIHVDMDAFYASVEQRDRPELMGKPVVVGGASGRGVVSAASYEARKFGIHSAMAGRKAAQLCPHAVFVKSNIQHYAEVGRQVREIFARFTPIIQPLSLDEAFLDVSGSLRLFGSAEAIGRAIQSAIRDELQLPASVGVAPLKFVAKIASDYQKPNGFVVVDESEVESFLGQLEIARLWGVGKVMQAKLASFGVKTVGDIRRLGQPFWKERFGRSGNHLWELANGIDDRSVVTDYRAKRIGHERTFHQDIADDGFLDAAMAFLSEQVARRLRNSRRRSRHVAIKYRLHDFKTYNRNASLPEPTDSTEKISEQARRLLGEMRGRYPAPIRLIGVSVGTLTASDSPRQLSLFDEEDQAKQQAVDSVSDQLQTKFGNAAIYRGVAHDWLREKRKD